MSLSPDPPAGLQPTFATRLAFVWALVLAALVTPPLAISLLINNLFSPNARTFKRWLTIWGKTLLFGVGVRVQSTVRADLPDDQPMVLVANHQNMIDIITCAAGIPFDYGYAAKEELRKMPFIGAVLNRSACVFVDRSSPRRAIQSVREAAELIRRGNSVLVFPEGERTFNAAMLPFQRGAFHLALEAGVPIVPVVQLDNYRVLDEERKLARPGTVHMVVCEAIPTSDYTRSELPRLIEKTFEVMQRELDAFHSSASRVEGADSVSSATRPPAAE